VNPVKGKYPTDFLDKVHPLIVEKRATVHVRPESVHKFPLIADIEIKDRKGASQNLAKIFKDLDPAVCKVSRMSAVFPISEKEIEVLDRAGHGLQPTQIQWDGRVEEESPNTIARHLNLYHKSMEGQTLPCQITGVHQDSSRGILVQLIPSDRELLKVYPKDNQSLRQKLEQNALEFDCLRNWIAAMVEQQPLVTDTDLKSLCLAKFSEDGLWYRAEIVSIPSADCKNPRVTVLFIDYGNKEKVFLTDLRELPPTLRVLPSQAVWFKLTGLKTHPDTVERTLECFQHPIIKIVDSQTREVEVRNAMESQE